MCMLHWSYLYFLQVILKYFLFILVASSTYLQNKQKIELQNQNQNKK